MPSHFRLNRIPDQRSDIRTAKVLHLPDAGGRCHVDLGHVVTDHIDAGEQQSTLLQIGPDGLTDFMFAFGDVGGVAVPPTCMLER